ncbi:MAG: nickel transporter [Vitreoscilla sp.]|nr:nickel transporter [Vitreoscilla sp.]
MHDLPADWSALCALVFLLGMRHGFDADHLATIDGLTRLNQHRGLALARYCGALFSAGHGGVVMLIAIVVGSVSERWVPPGWLDAFGAWVSIAFLLALGLVNLSAVLATPAGQTVALVGLKGRWLGRLTQARSRLGVAAVGAVFALSFDTISQSVLFAATATQFGGVTRAMMLALLFVLGMLVTDGLNGWWISRLIARADEIAALASRIMGAAVAGVSLLVAAVGVGKLLSPAFDGWSEGKDLALGTLVVGVIALSYLFAMAVARTRSGQPRQAA